MDLKIVFDFLLDLQFNNNRNWFKANEERYRNAKMEFEQLVDKVIPQLKRIDDSLDVSSAKDCVFRIYKDVRFSKNKEPYKTNFGAYISKGGRKSQFAGYYMHFEIDSSFIGGGIYMPQPDVLKAIRNEIYENVEEYKRIVEDKAFKSYFPEMYGEKLKTAPKDFPKDFSEIDFLKNKHFAITHSIDNTFWDDKNLVENIVSIFKVQFEFNQFLNKAVSKL